MNHFTAKKNLTQHREIQHTYLTKQLWTSEIICNRPLCALTPYRKLISLFPFKHTHHEVYRSSSRSWITFAAHALQVLCSVFNWEGPTWWFLFRLWIMLPLIGGSWWVFKRLNCWSIMGVCWLVGAALFISVEEKLSVYPEQKVFLIKPN